MGQLGTLLPPRGASFTPLCGMFLQSPSASSNVANFTFLRNPLSELWVCEFWLLRWSTMVARAWPVCVEVIQDWTACCPESNEPTLMFLWHFYPEISLWSLSMEVNGDVLLRCSKWLLGAWLDSFTMILRCWLVVWVNEPAPLSLWHCDPELCSIEKRFNWKDGPFHFCPTPLKVNGANFSTLLPPRGATFTPFWGMVLQSLPASSNVANFTFLWNPLSELRGIKFFSQC